MRGRHELTDDQCASSSLFCRASVATPGRTAKDIRLVVNAILYVARTGIPWRDLPERFGKWNTVWRRFDRWCAVRVWTTLEAELSYADLEELHLDSTSIKAQQSAAGARLKLEKRRRGPTPQPRALAWRLGHEDPRSGERAGPCGADRAEPRNVNTS